MQYQSMIQSHGVLVQVHAVEQVVELADQMEVQRTRVVESITAAVAETQSMLKSAAVPIEAPERPEPARQTVRDEPAVPEVAPTMELLHGPP